jgi:hypothetical protein
MVILFIRRYKEFVTDSYFQDYINRCNQAGATLPQPQGGAASNPTTGQSVQPGGNPPPQNGEGASLPQPQGGAISNPTTPSPGPGGNPPLLNGDRDKQGGKDRDGQRTSGNPDDCNDWDDANKPHCVNGAVPGGALPYGAGSGTTSGSGTNGIAINSGNGGTSRYGTTGNGTSSSSGGRTPIFGQFGVNSAASFNSHVPLPLMLGIATVFFMFA